MKHSSNQFRAPNSRLFSGSQVLESCAHQKPSKEIGWEMRKTVPNHVLAARVVAEYREQLHEVRESFRHEAPKLGILCKRVKGNKIQIVGHGIPITDKDGNVTGSTPRLVDNFADAKQYAESIGRSFAFMGAVKAFV